MKMRTAAIAFVASASGIQPTMAQTTATSFKVTVPTSCSLSQSAKVVTTLRDLPAVAAEFRRQKVDMVDAGGKFIPGDVEDKASQGVPRRQFVRAYVFKDRTIAWYYRGGYVTNFHIVELKMQRANWKGAPLELRLTGRALMGPPCAATEAILAGVESQQGW